MLAGTTFAAARAQLERVLRAPSTLSPITALASNAAGDRPVSYTHLTLPTN